MADPTNPSKPVGYPAVPKALKYRGPTVEEGESSGSVHGPTSPPTGQDSIGPVTRQDGSASTGPVTGQDGSASRPPPTGQDRAAIPGLSNLSPDDIKKLEARNKKKFITAVNTASRPSEIAAVVTAAIDGGAATLSKAVKAMFLQCHPDKLSPEFFNNDDQKAGQRAFMG